MLREGSGGWGMGTGLELTSCWVARYVFFSIRLKLGSMVWLAHVVEQVKQMSFIFYRCVLIRRLHYYRIYRSFEHFMQQYKPGFQTVALHFKRLWFAAIYSCWFCPIADLDSCLGAGLPAPNLSFAYVSSLPDTLICRQRVKGGNSADSRPPVLIPGHPLGDYFAPR